VGRPPLLRDVRGDEAQQRWAPSGTGVDAAYGERLARLTALEAGLDPTKVFRLNANIPPSAETDP
jgi:hypothetical protein